MCVRACACVFVNPCFRLTSPDCIERVSVRSSLRLICMPWISRPGCRGDALIKQGSTREARGNLQFTVQCSQERRGRAKARNWVGCVESAAPRQRLHPPAPLPPTPPPVAPGSAQCPPAGEHVGRKQQPQAELRMTEGWIESFTTQGCVRCRGQILRWTSKNTHTQTRTHVSSPRV